MTQVYSQPFMYAGRVLRLCYRQDMQRNPDFKTTEAWLDAVVNAMIAKCSMSFQRMPGPNIGIAHTSALFNRLTTAETREAMKWANDQTNDPHYQQTLHNIRELHRSTTAPHADPALAGAQDPPTETEMRAMDPPSTQDWHSDATRALKSATRYWFRWAKFYK